MTEPNDVFEAMSLAMADAELAPNPSYESLLKAALGAARELGYELVKSDGDFRETVARNKRQRVVLDWAKRCFTNAPVEDVQERSLRFIEEALELVQSAGLRLDKVCRFAAHVYGRPPGEIRREVGGVGVTLLALCEVLNLSADFCEVQEIQRVLQFDEDRFRARHQKKIDAGLAVDAAPDLTEGGGE